MYVAKGYIKGKISPKGKRMKEGRKGVECAQQAEKRKQNHFSISRSAVIRPCGWASVMAVALASAVGAEGKKKERGRTNLVSPRNKRRSIRVHRGRKERARYGQMLLPGIRERHAEEVENKGKHVAGIARERDTAYTPPTLFFLLREANTLNSHSSTIPMGEKSS